MCLRKDIAELVEAEIISEETAEQIHSYYQQKSGQSGNRLVIAFGILGAILVGLGIILIIAHNWDNLSRPVKTTFAFLPLLVGQGLCAYVLIKQSESTAWREGSATFLFFAIGASISLVSQIYNIPGNISSFILTWMLLSLPLVYLIRSSSVSLLYLIGITYYACDLSYWTYPFQQSYLYWPLLLLIVPHYYQLYRSQASGNFTLFHHWLVPLSVIISLGTLTQDLGELMFVAYLSLFGLLFLLGKFLVSDLSQGSSNSYTALGSLGTVIVLLILSFSDFWSNLSREQFGTYEVLTSQEFAVAALLTLLAGWFLYLFLKLSSLKDIEPLALVFLLFIPVFIIGLVSTVAVVLINLIVFVIGTLTIRNGARRNHLGILNYGLLIITALVVCRFFDTDLSFVVRGILFVSVGVGFFVANYRMLKQRKANA
ncbi:MAG: DUF2157 domain-containing protein [Cyclobacteriaceae bacterium]